MMEFGELLLPGCLLMLGGTVFFIAVAAFSILLTIKYYKRIKAELSGDPEDYFSREISNLQI
jgi:hypothetical protein